MDQHGVTVIGFGEAGRSFAKAGLWFASARVFDVATDDLQMPLDLAEESRGRLDSLG